MIRAVHGQWPLTFLLLFPVNLYAQDGDRVTGALEPTRPKVGLVLAGGGARGGAHVGVLKALEELRVPVDFIAGTSIGAIIGGFYASGMSVEEIETLIEELDWEAAFLETPPRPLKSFRRKRDDDLFLVEQKPGFNDREFDLPLGLVQGQVIDTILSNNTLRAAGIEDFDELPIPFRAVAADIVTGEAVVLGSGNLARALRASMSVPAVLSPIEIEGRLLVDGGIAMNMPIEVVREMGADVIIAVDVTSPLYSRDDLESVFDITAQLTSILTVRGVREQLEQLGSGDILLRPEFPPEFSSASFSQMSELIPLGYELTMREDALGGLAVEVAEFARSSNRSPAAEIPLPVVDFVRLNNNSNISDAVLERRLGEIEIGAPLDLEALGDTLDELYGLELYQNVRYALVDEAGRTGVEIELDERAWGPSYLQFGLELGTSTGRDPTFGVSASYLSTARNDRGGEWRATLALGDERELAADFHQPLGRRGAYFVAPSVGIGGRRVNVLSDDDVIASLRQQEAMLEIAAGREFGVWGEIRAGLRGGSGEIGVRVGDPALRPDQNFRTGEAFTRFAIDTVDSVAFPREGFIGSVEWIGSMADRLSADADYDQIRVSANYAKTWSRYTLVSTLRYDTTVNGTTPVYSIFELGGLFDLSGLDRNELTGQHAARIGGIFYRRLNDLAVLPAFAGISLEYGGVWEDRSSIGSAGARVGGSVWIGVDSPIGPVYAAYGSAEGGEGTFYLSLGRIF